MQESIETTVARIDENVKELKLMIPMIRKHDREILAAKVVLGMTLIFLASKHPWIAEVLAKVMG